MANEIIFRTATPDDAEAILRVQEVFLSGGVASPSPERIAAVQQSADQWRVGVREREIICTAHASLTEVWFGQSRLAWADVGQVAVLVSEQGQGLGSLVMTDMVQWLAAKGCAVSRLGGLIRFYRRFGYEPFPRCYLEFPIAENIRAGASLLPFADLLAPAFPGAGRVRDFDAQRDSAQVWGITENFTQYRTGCRVWKRPREIPASIPQMLVYESDGQVQGMATYNEYESDMTPFESAVMISNLAYAPGSPVALDALVKHILRRAHERKASRITALIPATEDVIADLKTIGLDFNLCQTLGAVAGNMIRILNLPAMLEQMQPELQNRSQGLRLKAGFAIDLGDQQTAVQLSAGRLSLREPRRGDLTIYLSHAEWLSAVLGVEPPAWHRFVAPIDKEWSALNALFPSIRGGYTS